MPNMSARTIHWNKAPFLPEISICTRRLENEEPCFRIFKEIEAKFPDGLGSGEVIGLGQRLRITRLREMERLGLDVRQHVIEFPFTGRQ